MPLTLRQYYKIYNLFVEIHCPQPSSLKQKDNLKYLQNSCKNSKPLVYEGILLPHAVGSHKLSKASSTGIEDKGWTQLPETTGPT